MDESLRSWIQNIVSGEKTYIFARIMHDDIVHFYTEEGAPFYKEKMKLPAAMHFDKLLVGVILADCQSEDSEIVKLKVKLVANPKEEDSRTAELAKFRKEIIQKFGL